MIKQPATKERNIMFNDLTYLRFKSVLAVQSVTEITTQFS